MGRVDSLEKTAGRDWGQEEKGTTEDEMAGWYHWLDGHESEWTLGVGDGQGGLVCCDSWGRKELDTTEWLNWTELRASYCRLSQLNARSISCLYCILKSPQYLACNWESTWDWVISGSWWWTGRPDMLQFMGLQSQTQLSNWIELTEMQKHFLTKNLSAIIPHSQIFTEKISVDKGLQM